VSCDVADSDNAVRRAGIWLACSAVGALLPVPLVVLLFAVLPLTKVDEVVGILIVLVGFLTIGWCSSLLAGLVCRRIAGVRRDFACVFLGNSSGWMSLLVVTYLIRGLLQGRGFGMDGAFMACYAVMISTGGCAITWAVMKPLTKGPRESCK
jgi:hypothetical protein